MPLAFNAGGRNWEGRSIADGLRDWPHKNSHRVPCTVYYVNELRSKKDLTILLIYKWRNRIGFLV